MLVLVWELSNQPSFISLSCTSGVVFDLKRQNDRNPKSCWDEEVVHLCTDRHHSLQDGEKKDQAMPLLINVVRLHRFVHRPCVRRYPSVSKPPLLLGRDDIHLSIGQEGCCCVVGVVPLLCGRKTDNFRSLTILPSTKWSFLPHPKEDPTMVLCSFVSCPRKQPYNAVVWCLIFHCRCLLVCCWVRLQRPNSMIRLCP